MGTLNQKRSFRVRFPCSKKLLSKFQTIVKTRKISSNDLLFNLIKKVRRPTEFQTNYQEQYKNKIKKKFAVRVTNQTYTDFGMFAVFFKTKSVALDYLISNEVDSGMDLTYSDSDSVSF